MERFLVENEDKPPQELLEAVAEGYKIYTKTMIGWIEVEVCEESGFRNGCEYKIERGTV